MVASPVSEYLRVLYKINELYSRYFTGQDDLLDEINYYTSKKRILKKDIKNIENKCKEEWEKILILFCKSLIKRIEKKQKYKNLFKIELKKIKKILKNVSNENISIDKYEKIFDEDLTSLNDRLDVKFYKEKRGTDRFWYGLIVGLVIGAIGIIISLMFWKNLI